MKLWEYCVKQWIIHRNYSSQKWNTIRTKQPRGFCYRIFCIIYIIISSISRGIKSTSKHLELLAEGNLSEEVAASALTLNNSTKEMLEEVNKFKLWSNDASSHYTVAQGKDFSVSKEF